MSRISVPEALGRIITALNEAGYEAYPVGGCVRDSLMGKIPKDWDAAVSAKPEQVKRALDKSDYKIIDTGIKHGTVTVIACGAPYEITTFRTDGSYTDNRRPDSVEFVSDIKDDLSRRDFTINAIAYDCVSDSIIDPFDGSHDIEAGIIRCVGEPDKRFTEDSLRILRGLRFASVIGFDIEESTSASIKKHAELLKNVSYERIYAELKMIICGEHIAPVLKEYRDVFARVIPEIEPMFDFPQRNPYHCYDVWEHTIHAVENVPPESALRFAALFHDSGKPGTHSSEIMQDGEVIDHFYNHGALSGRLAETALTRLKADNLTKDTAVYLAAHHGDMTAPTKKSVRRRLAKLDAEFKDGKAIFDMLIKIKLADVSAQAEHVRKNRIEELNKTARLAEEIIAEKDCFTLKDLSVNGRDIMSLGFSGPDIGQVLDDVLDKVISEKLSNDREAIIEYINKNYL